MPDKRRLVTSKFPALSPKKLVSWKHSYRKCALVKNGFFSTIIISNKEIDKNAKLFITYIIHLVITVTITG